MALNWLLNSAYTILLQHYAPRNEQTISDPKNEEDRLKMNRREIENKVGSSGGRFQMPLHYPRYAKSDYEKMEEWKVDALLRQYGLSFDGSLEEKRRFAMGAFLWPDQY
ncbi:uncharacterized protein LOC105176605 [Sesamum indicum]|uniref:Uncharacterized protein LOC105176605 n=1 Tax=Sesamum indicum TaxID=4182 RepID=A0A6I9U9U7_SESIN|nr:uncharacterized protein LOC105176605 [Sesamum indicum]